jgi:hypothetical protein
MAATDVNTDGFAGRRQSIGTLTGEQTQRAACKRCVLLLSLSGNGVQRANYYIGAAHQAATGRILRDLVLF